METKGKQLIYHRFEIKSHVGNGMSYSAVTNCLMSFLATFNFMSLVIKPFALGYIASWVGERLGLEEGNRNLISCLRS